MPIQTPRLYQSRHGVFYLRTVYPKLLQASTGKREAWHSLRTKDPKEARVFALSYALEIAKAQAGVNMRKKSGLEQAQELITDPLKITTPDGFTVDYDHTDPIATREAKAFIQDHTPAPITEAQRQAWQAQELASLRDTEAAFRQAEAEREAIIEAARKPKSRRFAPLVEEYFKLHAPNLDPRTTKKYRNANERFLDWLGKEATLDDITPAVWHQFKIFLASDDPATGRKAISPKTIDQYTNAVANVLKMAKGKDHALTGQMLVKRKQRQIPVLKAFTPDELPRIFNPDYLNQCRHPSDVWGTLLGLLTGARLNEIFQLRLADVRTVQGVLVLDFQEDTLGNNLKTGAARRFVPVHQNLIDLGFMDYLNDVRTLPNATDITLIFPFLNRYEQGYGDVPSQRFTALLKDLKIHQPRKKVFHSLRHTVNQKLKEAGISTEYRSMFIGHELGDTNTLIYGDKTPIQVIRDKVLPALPFEEIEWHKIRIDRTGIDEALGRLYRAKSKQKAN